MTTVYFQSPKGVSTEIVSPKKRTPGHSAFSMFENSRRIMGMVRIIRMVAVITVIMVGNFWKVIYLRKGPFKCKRGGLILEGLGLSE